LLELAEHVAETLDMGPGTRVFEVDCGVGDFLFPFYMNGYLVGGIDADADAIEQARVAMPNGTFQVATAATLDPAVPWDVVVCRSLSSAPSTNFTRGLVARMLAKATHAIVLLDVPAQDHQSLMHALAEAGAQAIQIEDTSIFARVENRHRS
jgi:trans-aconitate methyltransferase